MSTSHNTRRKK